MEGKNVVRNRFKAPEGRYELVSESKQLIQFHHLRWTRLTLAVLDNSQPDTDGVYVLFNAGDFLHISPWDATHKEPLRSLAVCNSTTLPLSLCHDFKAAADGVDTLAGVGNGTVHLMSLRVQLQGSASSTKPVFAASLTPEAASTEAKCVAVAWLPKTDGMFVAAFASGSIYVYKKSSILGEGGNRFSLGLGSSSKQSTTPANTLTITGRGIHDLAASPCGTRLAAACCDGALRLIDVATGTVIGGFQSYYGAMLCCSFSPDGRYVAAASEDDLVAVFSVPERYLVAHCQGHGSWESRVAWDPWMQLTGGGLGGVPGVPTSTGGTGPLAVGATDGTRLYRLASVGQDAQMCLWDVQVGPLEGDLFATPVVAGVRKSASNVNLAGSPTRASGDSSMLSGGSISMANSGALHHHHHHHGHHQRKPSVGKPAVGGGGILPAPQLADMNYVQPSMQHRVHVEPLSDVLFTESCILTADYCGSIRTWKRPTLLRRSSMSRAGAASSAGGLQGAAAGAPALSSPSEPNQQHSTTIAYPP